MTHFLIFYSWQSDSPNRTNRGLIGEALRQASRAVSATADIEEPVRVTSDTQGAPGSPDISQTIFENIDTADAFVADVTLAIPHGPEDRRSPNPNVLIELGYAARALKWHRLILVLNTAFGAIESLPFDLRGRRIVTYHFPDQSEIQPALVRGTLIRRLEDSLQEITALGRNYRGPSDLLKQHWLPEFDQLRDILRGAIICARQPFPPLQTRSAFGLVP